MRILKPTLLVPTQFRCAAALLLAAAISAAPAATNTVVNTNNTGAGSLRQTIAGSVSGDTIIFNASLSGQTILLTSAQLLLNKDLIIDASALPGGIQISGNHSNRVFEVAVGVTATLSSLTIQDGYAPNGSYPANAGGGILNRGMLTVTNCTVTNNQALQGFNTGGGGIENSSGTLTVHSSTIAGNSSTVGGGIESYVVGSGGCTLNQCTVTGNSAGSYGGGLYNFGVFILNQSTVTSNSAPNSGGGIANYATLNVFNSVVAGNSSGGNMNISGSYSPSGINLIGTAAMPIDPQLAPLGNYGGPTQTMLPLPGSPAIDAAAPTPFTTDQRGLPRPFDFVPDIGAVESQEAKPLVTNNADAGAGSLRYALANYTNGNTITFATNLSGTTIVLTSGQLMLNKNYTIDASPLPGGLRISGNGTSRIFQMAAGTVNVLNSLTLTNGNGSTGAGGAINNHGNLTANRCTLAGNSAIGGGGGIWSDGTLTLNQCTLAGNSVSAKTIAAWTFETSQPTSLGPFNPEVGSGSATGFHAGSVSYTHPTGNGSANSFTANAWAIGDYFQFSVSTLGQYGLKVAWDQISSTNGPRDFNFQYSTDGTNFTPFGSNYVVLSNAAPTLWTTTNRLTSTSYTNDLTAITALNNQATVYFRLVDASSTSATGGTVNSSGTDRVDNFVVRATGGGGGLAGAGTLTVKQSTLAGNSASDTGGGLRNFGTLTLANSVVAGNSAPAEANLSGAFTGGTNLLSGDPLLAALGNYGGPTPTMPPLTNSPVLDAGDDVAASIFPTDQRGSPRLSGLHVDLGAVELQVINSAVPPTLTSAIWLGNGGFSFSFTNVAGTSFTVLTSTNLAWPLNAWSNLGPALETPPSSGQFQFTDSQATNDSQRYYRARSP